jgi:dipeptidyl aminopeptidase/acylaminoacyl peptidase
MNDAKPPSDSLVRRLVAPGRFLILGALLAALLLVLLPLARPDRAASLPSASAGQAASDRLVFIARPQEGGPPTIFSAQGDGSGMKETVGANPSISGLVTIEAPALSPDRSRLVFQGEAPSGGVDLYVANADGTGLQQITHGAGLDGGPAWSPDGKWIAFGRNGTDGHPEIFMVASDGSGEQQLTNNDVADAQPDWAPNGTQVAFTRNNQGVSDIYVLDIATGLETRITDGTGGASDPAWSPDGLSIAFTQDRNGNNLVDLNILSLATEESIIVVKDIGSQAAALRWSPDGQQLAYSAWVDTPGAASSSGASSLVASRPGIVIVDIGTGAVELHRFPVDAGPLFDW